MAHRWTSELMVVASAALLWIACGDSPMSAGNTAGTGGRPSGPEFVPAPSFDECYPWKKGDPHEPPTFQLFGGQPYRYLMVMPGHSTYGDSANGWEAGLQDVEFVPLWELGKAARQQHTQGEDLTGGEPGYYLMSIGCGDFYRWHVRVNETFAETGEGATAELARELFALMDSPPADAAR